MTTILKQKRLIHTFTREITNAFPLKGLEPIDDRGRLIMPPDIPEEYSCFAAGGAIRDHFFSKPGEDIDLFISIKDLPSDSLTRQPMMIALLNTEGWNGRLLDDEDYIPNQEIYEATKDDDKIHVIVTKDYSINETVNRFGCNLSQAYYDSGSRITMYTQDFIDGIMNKTLIFGHQASDEYIEKIIKKFPDYKIRGYL